MADLELLSICRYGTVLIHNDRAIHNEIRANGQNNISHLQNTSTRSVIKLFSDPHSEKQLQQSITKLTLELEDERAKNNEA